MDASLTPYTTFRETGEPWLPRIPQHWAMRRLKYVLREKNDRSPDGVGTLLSLTRTRGLIKQSDLSGKGPTAKTLVGYKNCKPGDVVMNRMQAWSGMFAVASDPGLVSPDYAVFAPILPVAPEFLLNLLRSPQMVSAFAIASKGIGTGFNRLYTDKLGAIAAPLPPPEEQAAIVAFIAALDRRVNRFIRAKRRLIELLTEQKQAIITHAVTRGLNPAAPTRPSGHDWLGDVPEHWEVRRLRTLVSRIDQGVSPQAENRLADVAGSWGVLKSGCVNRGVFRAKEHKRLPHGFDIDPGLHVSAGDVLVSRACGSPDLVGSVGRVTPHPYRLILSDKTFRPVFAEPRRVPFLVHAMNSSVFRRQVRLAVSGAEGLANNLPLSSLRGFVLPVPPPEEAEAIADRIDRLLNEKFSAIALAEREVDLIREYRTRVVADVVTGKCDVCRRAIIAVRQRAAGRSAGLGDRAAALLDAEIVHRSHLSSKFGRTVREKLNVLCRRHARLDQFASSERRLPRGPADLDLRDRTLLIAQEAGWFTERQEDKHFRYVPLAHFGSHRDEYREVFGESTAAIDEVLSMAKGWSSKRCEIVATLYCAWNDLLIWGDEPTDAAILREVLENWRPEKLEIPEETWRKHLAWLRNSPLTPKGFGEPTTTRGLFVQASPADRATVDDPGPSSADEGSLEEAL